MDDSSFSLLKILCLAGAAGLFFFLRRVFPSLATVLLIMGGIFFALLLILVAVVLYFALRKKPGKEHAPASTDTTALLSKGRSILVEYRRLGMQIKNQQIRKKNEEICSVADKILCTLKKQPDDIPRARQFFQYYLPTLGSILMKYVRLEEGGVVTADTTERTLCGLGNIYSAMEKQYASLFDNDVLDLTVEMEVLTAICKRDGLLDEDNNLPHFDVEPPIKLTL